MTPGRPDPPDRADDPTGDRPVPRPESAPTPSSPPRERVRPASAVALGGGGWAAPKDLRYAYSRSSGPGGQHVNKVNTRAELRVSLDAIGGLNEAARARLRVMAGARLTREDELILVSEGTRSQRTNRDDCLERLRELVTRAATPPKVRKKTKPTRGSRQRRLDSKRRQGEKKRNRGWRPD